MSKCGQVAQGTGVTVCEHTHICMYVYLRAAAQCRRPLRWGPAQVLFVLSAAFGLLACLLACLFACFQRFSRPHSFAHSEREPKECAGSRKEKERNQRSAPSAEKEKGRKKAGRAGRDRASALKTVPCRCLSAVPCENRPNGLAVTELQR